MRVLGLSFGMTTGLVVLEWDSRGQGRVIDVAVANAFGIGGYSLQAAEELAELTTRMAVRTGATRIVHSAPDLAIGAPAADLCSWFDGAFDAFVGMRKMPSQRLPSMELLQVPALAVDDLLAEWVRDSVPPEGGRNPSLESVTVPIALRAAMAYISRVASQNDPKGEQP